MQVAKGRLYVPLNLSSCSVCIVGNNCHARSQCTVLLNQHTRTRLGRRSVWIIQILREVTETSSSFHILRWNIWKIMFAMFPMHRGHATRA